MCFLKLNHLLIKKSKHILTFKAIIKKTEFGFKQC